MFPLRRNPTQNQEESSLLDEIRGGFEALGIQYVNTNTQIIGIKAQITGIQAGVDESNTFLEEMRTEMDQIQARMNGMEVLIRNLYNKLGGLYTQTYDVSRRMGNIENSFTSPFDL